MSKPIVKQSSRPAVKHDQGKPDFSMISYDLMEEVAYVRMFGAKKYSRSNWQKGFAVTRSCAAALRHIFLFLKGETLDHESGLSHLAHAVCCLEHALFDMRHHPENDDRDSVVAKRELIADIKAAPSPEGKRMATQDEITFAGIPFERHADWIAP
jgi:hypothetical protein